MNCWLPQSHKNAVPAPVAEPAAPTTKPPVVLGDAHDMVASTTAPTARLRSRLATTKVMAGPGVGLGRAAPRQTPALASAASKSPTSA